MCTTAAMHLIVNNCVLLLQKFEDFDLLGHFEGK